MKTKTLLIYAVVLTFVFLNILSSQTISGLFLGFSKGQKQDSVDFLKKIRKEAYFSQIFDRVSSYFDEDLSEEVNSEMLQRQEKIRQLEEILSRNPKARDVLYNLHVLYLREGEDKIAQDYLQRAREVDPEIK